MFSLVFNDVSILCMYFHGSVNSMFSSRDFWGYQGLAECVSCSKMFPRDICSHFVGSGCVGSVSMGEESA